MLIISIGALILPTTEAIGVMGTTTAASAGRVSRRSTGAAPHVMVSVRTLRGLRKLRFFLLEILVGHT